MYINWGNILKVLSHKEKGFTIEICQIKHYSARVMFRTPVNHIIPTLYLFFVFLWNQFFQNKEKRVCPWRAEISTV